MPQPPSLNPLSNQSAHPSNMLTFTAMAIDPQGSPIQYSLVNSPVGATINSTSGQFTWTPAWSQLGAFNVTVQATATMTGLSDTKSCTVAVTNQSPVLSP